MLRSSGSIEKRMAKRIKTRRIKAEDALQIVAIQESIIKKKVSRRWVQMVENHLKKEQATGFIASKDARVVGFIIGEIKGEGFGLEQSGWIEVVGVHPSQMGIGIGRILAEKLFQFFKKNAIRDIYT
jgi:ribosomal protein S18 acetylase RimI-like enzyme